MSTIENLLHIEQIRREATTGYNIVDAEARHAAVVSEDAAESLIYHFESSFPRFSPDQLGYDLRRLFGDDGFDLYAIASAVFGDSEANIARLVAGTHDAWLNDRRASFDRPRTDTDAFLIDIMDSARDSGWTPPADVAAQLTALEDIAEANRAARDLRTSVDDLDTRLAEYHTGQAVMRDAAQAEWEAFGGVATQAQVDAWYEKFAMLTTAFERQPQPVTIIPFPAQPAAPFPDMIQSSGEFVEGFTPPDYLLDGVLQLRFCYSLTAKTGVGKTAVALLLSALVSDGRPLGKTETTKGTVLYLAGENPTDVQMRWLGLTQELRMDPRATDVHFLAGPKDLGQYAQAIKDEVTRKGLSLSLVVIDTAAAYNQGDDENSNAQAGAFARQLRSLVNLPGEPCVLILCHPTKNAGDDALVPRGGGAFLAEVDGNIALRKRDSLIEATNLGKFRGPDMVPLSFVLQKVNHPKLKDTRGRPIPTVVARPVTEAEGASMKATARRHEDMVLKDVGDYREASMRDRARRLRWFYSSGSPDVSKVQRGLDKLVDEKLIRKVRDNYELTQTGEREINRLDLQAPETKLTPMFPTVAPHATATPPMPPPLPPV